MRLMYGLGGYSVESLPSNNMYNVNICNVNTFSVDSGISEVTIMTIWILRKLTTDCQNLHNLGAFAKFRESDY